MLGNHFCILSQLRHDASDPGNGRRLIRAQTDAVRPFTVAIVFARAPLVVGIPSCFGTGSSSYFR